MAEFNQSGHNPICVQIKDVGSWSDTKIAEEMLQPTLTITLRVKVFIPVVFVIGSFGNVAFLLLLARVKTMRTITNFYLVNVAAADLLILYLQTLQHSWHYVNFKHVESVSFYTNFGIFYFALHVPSLSSIVLITLVSFDRYFSICYPIKYRITKNKRACYMLTPFTWIISAVLSLFRSLASARLEYECILWPSNEKCQHFPDTVRHCTPIHPLFQREILEHVVHSAPFIVLLL